MSYYQPPGYQPYNQFGGYPQPPPSNQPPPQQQPQSYGYNNNNTNYQQQQQQQQPSPQQPPGYTQPPAYQYQPSQTPAPSQSPSYSGNHGGQQQQQQQQQYSNPNTPRLTDLSMKWVTDATSYQQVLDGVRSVADAHRLSFFEPQRVYTDLAGVIWDTKRYSLHSGEYFSNLGEQMHVLQLKGLLPITFRNSTYKTPLLIHIPSAYPTKPPIIYVTPTPDLRISPKCPFVQADGQVIHNYLNNWNKHTCTVALFLQHLAQSFGEAPPLFAAQPGYQAQTPQPQQQQQFQPPTPGAYNPPSYGGHPPTPTAQPPQSYEPPQPTQAELDFRKKQQLEDLVQVKVESAQDEQFRTLKKQLETANIKKRDLHRVCFNQDFILEARNDQLAELNRLDSALDSDLALLRKLCANDAQQDTTPAVMAVDNFIDEKRVVLDGYTKQLIMEDANDSAIDDVLMRLDNLLDENKISLDSYLKEVRTYARKQFLARALAKKVMDQM